VRFAIDGTATLLAVRPGSRGTLVRGDDTSVVIVGHEPPPAGAGRLAIIELQCASGMPPATGAAR
jgi:hypothetical protein